MAGKPGRRRRGLRPALIAAAALVVAVVAAWALQAAGTHGAGESKGSSPPAYSIRVEKGGEVLKQYDLAALHALPQSTITIDGKEQDGPTLAMLLADAGVTAYSRVRVKGAALRDSGHATLSGRQVSQGVQLDFSDRGTVKVCGPRLERPSWVRDVLTISAE